MTSKTTRFLSGTAVLATAVPCGFLTGGFIASRLSTTGMGWDRLADALGGMMVGVVAGVILGAVLVARLGVRGRLVAAGFFAAAAVVTIVAFRLVPAPKMDLPPPPAPPPPRFEPAYSFSIGAFDESVEPIEGVPYRWFKLHSPVRRIDTVAWTPGARTVQVEAADEALSALAAVLADLEKPPECPPCDGCGRMAVSWSLPPADAGGYGVGGGATVGKACLLQSGAYAPLLAVLERFDYRLCCKELP